MLGNPAGGRWVGRPTSASVGISASGSKPTRSNLAAAYVEDFAFFKKFGIHRQEAGLNAPSVPDSPELRGLAAAGTG
jgi:hypothetical protein